MKKILLLAVLVLTTQIINAQTVVLDTNGVTVKWTGTQVPAPHIIKANPRGIMEKFAIVDNSSRNNINEYAKNIRGGVDYFAGVPFNNIVTTLMTDMNSLFSQATAFNKPIGSWDVSKVSDMSEMFYNTPFNQPIGAWNVWNVKDMSAMFQTAHAFNQPIGAWNVSNVTRMFTMFQKAHAFNQPIGAWNVGNVTTMAFMFSQATAFNQPIDSWDVSKVTNMSFMFEGSSSRFYPSSSFNQPLGAWNVSSVTDMSFMFSSSGLSSSGLSTSNYDATLIGWATKVMYGVKFSGGKSKYCNGLAARNYLTNTYGWIITDSGLDCAGLGAEAFDKSSVSLYPNPALGLLNIKVDDRIANKPYSITDALGKIVLKGKLNEGDATINVEHLSKGIYYMKISNNKASKFIKE
jgi:surface protein